MVTNPTEMNPSAGAKPSFPVQCGATFAAGHLGPLSDLMRYRFSVAALGDREVPGKVFLKEALGMTGLEMSWNSFPVGAGMPFSHTHRDNEEVYLFVQGEGEFMVDGEAFRVGEGSVVRVSPAGVRAYRNTGASPLVFVVLQVPQHGMQHRTIDDGAIVPGPVSWPDSSMGGSR